MSLVALLVPVPAMALLLGAVIAAGPATPAPGWRRAGVLAAPALALVAAVALAARTWGDPTAPVRLTLSPWSPSVFDTGVGLYADLLTAFCLVLVCLVALGAACRGHASADRQAVAGPLLVSAAAALFIVAAAEPLGLVFAWLVLDLALLVSGGGSKHVWFLGVASLAMAIAGLVHLPSATADAATPLGTSEFWSRWWLIGAAAVRMGLYPLWWAIPPAGDRPWRALGTRLAPTIAGAYLVLRVTEQTAVFEGLNEPTLAPAIAAAVCGALLAWLATARGETLDWLVTFQASLVVMAALLGGSIGHAIAVMLLVDLVLARGVLYAVEGVSESGWIRLSRWVAAASVSALPPTLGFAGRWLLYRELLANRVLGALLLAVGASALATIALGELLRVRAPTGRSDRFTTSVLLVPAVATLVLGIGVPWAGPLLERLTGTTLPSSLADLAATLTNRLTVVTGLELVALLVVPIALAVVVRPSPGALVDSRRRTARRWLQLSPLLDAGTRALLWGGATAHRATGLLESQRAMAWTVMAAAVTGTTMLAAAAPDPAAVGASSLGAVVTFAAACGLVTILLFAPAPAGPLLALGGTYFLAGAMLARTDGILLLALIKALVGMLVVGILVISVAQLPVDHRLAGAADRLRHRHWADTGRDQHAVMGVSLVVALILAYGMQTTSITGALPDGVLRTAAVMMLGGVLTTVFARDPLRLATGVLVALTGFELAYAHLDPGLLITGALAAFELLFALVASYHVGLTAEVEDARS